MARYQFSTNFRGDISDFRVRYLPSQNHKTISQRKTETQ